MEKKTITNEDIKRFIEGHDPMEHIVNITYKYQNPYVTVFYRDKNDRKCRIKDNFYPFLWATRYACVNLCHGNRQEIMRLMNEYNIGVKKLRNTDDDGVIREEFDKGYLFLFYAKKPMSYGTFLNFFKKCDRPVYNDNKKLSSSDDSHQYLVLTPVEQYMIATGRRYFKGYDNYDEILRMIFDLETEGLDPRKHRIKLNGIRFNRPVNINGVISDRFEKNFRITGETKSEKDRSELEVIDQMLRIIYTFQPDIITAHNGENFDWNFIITRCQMLGTSIEAMSCKYFEGDVIKKEARESILKLGSEIETFHRTIVPNTTITDSMHAVRRAQATDSNFLKGTLKYATAYLNLKKKNRVYTPGDKIDNILIDKVGQYAFNDEDGDWYLYDPNYKPSKTNSEFKKGLQDNGTFRMYTRNKIYDGYKIVSGEYIINRYLLDDLWECDKVEYSLNGTEFVLCKMLPVPFSKCCTMGTAGQWKSIMCAWSYENGLAIPELKNTGKFTGGLSRLLCTGFVDNVIKLDYNSLYPSIILTWGISDSTDLMHAMLYMLEYVLTTRETYKGLKKKAGKVVDKFEERINNGEKLSREDDDEYNNQLKDYKVFDGRQASVKKLGNSFFGSYGANNGAMFPWKSLKCAEMTTCIGRQSLRLMISHFSKLGYKPIVGDSVAPDTPLFIKWKDNNDIDIISISDIIDNNSIKTDELGREYDYSSKPYQVLCRSGWCDVDYVYRHKTNKDIYRVSISKDNYVDITKDHSLFDAEKKQIKPSDIKKDTNLEYYNGEIKNNSHNNSIPVTYGKMVAKYGCKIPRSLLNSSESSMKEFYNTFMENYDKNINYSKVCLAGIKFIKSKINA